MAVAISLLCHNKSYYYEADLCSSILISNENHADIVIEELAESLVLSLTDGEYWLSSDHATEIKIPLNRIVEIDAQKQVAIYISPLMADEYRIPLPKTGEWNVGRVKGKNSIVVGLPFVSSTHFKVTRKQGITVITDLNSTNGTFLNGKKCQQSTFQDGDILTIFTLRITLMGDVLIFKNAGLVFSAEKVKNQPIHSAAEKKHISAAELQFSRSPRMIETIETKEIILEKPPQSNGKPQINWLSILITPILSIALMVVLVFAMGMNATMLIMSGVMSVASALVAIINYKKQKSKHSATEELIDVKYRNYLSDVAARIDNNKQKQLGNLTTANPNPTSCVSFAINKDRRLWERSMTDQDFLAVRLGTGTIPASLTAKYKQAEVVINESDLDIAAKQVAENSQFIRNAPILCSLKQNKMIGITGERLIEEQLVRNIIVEIATAHSYDEVKVVCFASEEKIHSWNWLRWLPHCSDDQKTVRYIFSNIDDAEKTLDSINDILNRRSVADDYGKDVDQSPYYIFVMLSRQMIEKHPIRKHLFSSEENGCCGIFAYDNIAYLPKECKKIIEVQNTNGVIYDRLNASEKTHFCMDNLSDDCADIFARALAPLKICSEGQDIAVPTSISFLEGYEVTKPEELNIASRWQSAKTYKSLSVPIAASAGGDIFSFDIHEKRHGVNGIVAGMPGSGKTEMVQSWLLSLAVNYSPQDVSFILIDFKGTGMIAPFKKLPHLAGSISNLDTNIDRNLIAIQSEIHRREALIDKYSDKNIKNINDLNKAYDKGLVPEKLPILLVVIDEYAEFKKIFPDFGAEIDSLTSKGRALGMFVVLMTQKPAGVVSAKSEDNIKFRWCLRVANYSASREMLGKADAAKINNPGRAYIKVGEDDVYEQVQSFWSGAPYVPDKDKKKETSTAISYVRFDGKRIVCEQIDDDNKEQSNESEIDVVVRHIISFCKQNNIAHAEKIWTNKLPEKILLSDIQRSCFSNNSGWTANNILPAVGLIDDPKNQQQYPLTIDFAQNGHVVIYGAPVAGKTTLLQTLAMSVALTNRPDMANIYAMDFGGWNLNVLKELPHVGGIANDNEPERIKKLVALITEMLEERKTKFSAAGVGNITSYRDAVNADIADIILLVDNIGFALKQYPELGEFFGIITGSGANYGIYVVATALAANAVPIKISQNIKYVLALQLIEKSDYTYTVGKITGEIPSIPGRGYTKGKTPLLFQAAIPAPGDNEKEISDNIRKTAVAMNAKWNGMKAAAIPELPSFIPYGSIKTNGICLGLSTEKVVPVAVDLTLQHYLMISGMPKSGKTNLLLSVAKQCKEKTGGAVYVFDVANQMPAAIHAIADKYLSEVSDIDAFIESIRPKLQHRLEEKQRNPDAVFSEIVFVIDDYRQFHKLVSNDTITRLHAIVKLGKELSLKLIVASDAYELTELVNKGEVVALSMVRGEFSVALGGSPNDHASIKTNLSYAQKNEPVNTTEGFLVYKMNCIRFKAMCYTGDNK